MPHVTVTRRGSRWVLLAPSGKAFGPEYRSKVEAERRCRETNRLRDLAVCSTRRSSILRRLDAALRGALR